MRDQRTELPRFSLQTRFGPTEQRPAALIEWRADRVCEGAQCCRRAFAAADDRKQLTSAGSTSPTPALARYKLLALGFDRTASEGLTFTARPSATRFKGPAHEHRRIAR